METLKVHSSDPPPFNFDYHPWREGNIKKLKRGQKYGAGVGLIKRGY